MRRATSVVAGLVLALVASLLAAGPAQADETWPDRYGTTGNVMLVGCDGNGNYRVNVGTTTRKRTTLYLWIDGPRVHESRVVSAGLFRRFKVSRYSIPRRQLGGEIQFKLANRAKNGRGPLHVYDVEYTRSRC